MTARPLLTLATTLALMASATYAGTVATGLDAEEAPLQSSLARGAFESNDKVRVMFEGTTTLSSALTVDMTPPAVGKTCNSSLTCSPAGDIAGGTAVESWILHADPDGSSSRTYEGSVQFSNRILGVILTRSRLNSSDSIVGGAGVVYATGELDRGMELPGQDSFDWNAPTNTITFSFTTSTSIDNIRVLTATPEPSTFALMALGLGAAVIKSIRRRW